MTCSLDLSLLNSEVKIPSLGTCIAILDVHCRFLFILKMCLYRLIFIPSLQMKRAGDGMCSEKLME